MSATTTETAIPVSPESPIRGSCLCGGVRFEITSAPLWMATCHCTRCRKAGANPHVDVRAEHFRWVEGEDLVERYVPPAPYHLVRCFCRVCGTPLGEPDTNDTGFPVAANALDDDPGVRPCIHGWISEKPEWNEILDDLPQFAREPG